ncbi:MAG TPA: preprotein translocase subunit SecG [Candidatus Binataceae bacterium]|jgi:preprotein translocase subunit SecG|nr:preprotein translocase subunit SecG [Candidatus Binataceae bacterium]
MLISIVITVHILVCITLVGVVLLQQGRGADVGAVFGGSSQTVFGASGAGNLLTKTTWALAIVFFSTSLFLAYTSARRTNGSIFEGRRLRVPVSAPAKATTGATSSNPVGSSQAGKNGAPSARPSSAH